MLRACILALTLVGSAALAAGPEVTPDEELDVAPDWLKNPSYQDLQAVWPGDALRGGRGGKAMLRCEITPQGLLENCKVESETPPNQGFGSSALLLAPSFVLRPGMKDGKPVRSRVGIPVVFRTAGRIDTIHQTTMPMIAEPIWQKAPSFADMDAAWPRRAKAEFGHVSMRCGFTEEGYLHRCKIITETPGGQGFGKAAKEVVAPGFQLRVPPERTAQIAKAFVNLPVRFTNPGAAGAAPRTIAEPKWITGPDPEKVLAIYPDAALKAGVASGRGMANCLVANDGALTDCRPAPATPPDLGFSEAAVQIASIMKMNPWSDGGGPVDGVRINLPIVFNLKPAEATPTP